ncbi:hypothetical protein EDB80DRAFT_815067 [Ilyonectria destructans]|nr:hypothetical protein EDB80DRAFT_815067 [Ilyonectria destructans]
MRLQYTAFFSLLLPASLATAAPAATAENTGRINHMDMSSLCDRSTSSSGIVIPEGTYRGNVTKKPATVCRSEPAIWTTSLGNLEYGTSLNLSCTAFGQAIEGNPTWYQTRFGGKICYVSTAYITYYEYPPPYCS